MKLQNINTVPFNLFFYRNFKKYENGLDLGMKPAHGLKPPKLKVYDMNEEMKILHQGK